MSELRAVRYHNGYHWCAAIAKRGTKHIHLVHIADCGVVVSKEPMSEEKHLQPLQHNNKPYPLPRMVRHFKAFGRQRGITKGAKAIMSQTREAV
jgi:hypothetical protein